MEPSSSVLRHGKCHPFKKAVLPGYAAIGDGIKDAAWTTDQPASQGSGYDPEGRAHPP